MKHGTQGLTVNGRTGTHRQWPCRDSPSLAIQGLTSLAIQGLTVIFISGGKAGNVIILIRALTHWHSSSGITCLFLFATFSKAEPVTNRPIRAVIKQHVAFDAIPSGVPVTALPSCFSFSCRWHILSVEVSACFVSTFQLATVAAT